MAFNADEARKAGYSDAEIADYLSKEAKFDYTAAKEAGYGDDEIVNYLSAPAPAAAPAPVPAPAAPTPATARAPSVSERLGQAYQLQGERYIKPGAFGTALVQGTTDMVSSLGRGYDVLRGKPPTTEELLGQQKDRAKYISRMPASVQKQLEEEGELSGKKEEATKNAEVWKVPSISPAGVVEAYVDPSAPVSLSPKQAAEREAAIKARMERAKLPDTPENRLKVYQSDVNAARGATKDLLSKQISGLKSWENVKRITGEQLPGLAGIYGPTALLGRLRPILGEAFMASTAAAMEADARLQNIVAKELKQRGLEYNEENLDTLFKDKEFVDKAVTDARIGGAADALAFTATASLGGRAAASADRAAIKIGEEQAKKAAVERAKNVRLAAEGRMGVEAEATAADRLAKPTARDRARETQKALENVSTSARVLAAATGSVVNLVAPSVGQVVGDLASGKEIDTEAVRDKFIGNLIFAPMEALAIRKAYIARAAIQKSSPENIAKEDLNTLWGDKYETAKTDEDKEAVLDAISKVQNELYHSTGTKASEREHLRDDYSTDMRKAYDGYKELLEAELAKPEDKQDKDKIARLNFKLERSKDAHIYTSAHPLFPELTVEEAFEFERRNVAADRIEDPVEADRVRQGIQSDIEKLRGARRAKTETTGAGARDEVGEAGQPPAGVAGEGAGERVQEGAAEVPGAEGVGTVGLGGRGRPAGGPDVGTEARTAPLAPEEITQGEVSRAIKILRNPESTREQITQLADKFNLPYDAQEDTRSINQRLRSKVATLKQALEHEAELGGDVSRRGGRPGAITHEEVTGLTDEYSGAWGVKINAARNAAELRELGYDVADDVRGIFDPVKKEVWINSENHNTHAEVKSTIFHETLGHYGLRKKFRDDLDRLLLDIYNKNDGIKREVEKWQGTKISEEETNRDTYSHLDKTTQIARAVEEILAERSESGRVKTGIHRQLIALVRNYLRKIPKVGEKLKYSDNDILHILRDAHNEIVRGRDVYSIGPDGQLRYSFVGPQAQLHPEDRKNLDVARMYEQEGKHPAFIVDATGWFRNPVDGKWRLEQSDRYSWMARAIKDIKVGKDYNFDEVFHHDRLFKLYPDLAYVKVRREKMPANQLGYFDPNSNTIYINSNIRSPDVARGILLHESMHWIQKEEDFARGGNPAEVAYHLNMDARMEVGQRIKSGLENISGVPDTVKHMASDAAAGDRKALIDLSNMLEKGNLTGDTQDIVARTLFDAYENLTGEHEARLVERRKDMTPEELIERPISPTVYEGTYPTGVDNLSAAQKVSQPSAIPPSADPKENIRYSRKRIDDLSKTAEEMPRFDRGAYNKFMNLLSDLGAARYSAIKILDTAKIAELYDVELPAVRPIHTLTGQKSAVDAGTYERLKNLSNKWFGSLEKISKVDPKFYHEFSDVAHRTTIEQIDPLDANTRKIYEDVKNKVNKKPTKYEQQVHDLLKRYEALPPEAKAIYKELREYYDDLRERLIAAVDKHAGASAANKLRKAYIDNGLQVYLPLGRQGDYWLAYEDVNGVPHELAFDTPRQRDKARKWAESQGYNRINPYSRTERDAAGQLPVGLLDDVIADMRANNASPNLIRDVTETFMDYANSGSAMQMFRKREGVEGYNQNVVGTFSLVAPRLEAAITGIEYRKKFEDALGELYKEIQLKVPGSTMEKMPEEYKTLVDHLKNHVNVLLNPPTYKGIGKAADMAAKFVLPFNYYWTIAGRASTALANTLSVPTLSVPYLGVEFGLNKSYDAHARALDMYMKGGFERSKMDFVPDWTFMENAKGEYRILGNALLDSGVITRHNGTDLYQYSNIKPKDWNRRLEGAQRIVGYGMQNTERLTREVSALAAYMLKRESGASIKDSIDFAIKHTEFTTGPGSISTTAPALKHPVARVAMSMRRWAFTVGWQQARLLTAATIGIDGKTRSLAAKQLAASLVHSGLLLGVKGMPFMGAVSLILAAMHSFGIYGDPDQPFIPDEEINKVSGDFYGGIMDELLGANISASASLSDIWWRDNPYDLRKSGAVDYFMHQIGGVTFGVGSNIVRGAVQVFSGDLLRGFETIVPGGVRGVLRDIRYAAEGGPKTAQGAPMVTGPSEGKKPIKLGPWDYFITGIGFTPKDIADYQRRHANALEDLKQLEDLKSLQDLYKAIDKGDEKLRDKAIKKYVDVLRANRIIVNSKTINNIAKGYVEARKGSAIAEKYADNVRSKGLSYLKFLEEHSEANE